MYTKLGNVRGHSLCVCSPRRRLGASHEGVRHVDGHLAVARVKLHHTDHVVVAEFRRRDDGGRLLLPVVASFAGVARGAPSRPLVARGAPPDLPAAAATARLSRAGKTKK